MRRLRVFAFKINFMQMIHTQLQHCSIRSDAKKKNPKKQT